MQSSWRVIILYEKIAPCEGGGVVIYFRDHLDVKERTEVMPDCFEAVCIEVIRTKSKPILVTTLYRPKHSI